MTEAKRYIPIYMFFVGFLIAMVTLLKGLKHVFKDNGMTLTFLDSANDCLGRWYISCHSRQLFTVQSEAGFKPRGQTTALLMLSVYSPY